MIALGGAHNYEESRFKKSRDDGFEQPTRQAGILHCSEQAGFERVDQFFDQPLLLGPALDGKFQVRITRRRRDVVPAFLCPSDVVTRVRDNRSTGRRRRVLAAEYMFSLPQRHRLTTTSYLHRRMCGEFVAGFQRLPGRDPAHGCCSREPCSGIKNPRLTERQPSGAAPTCRELG